MNARTKQRLVIVTGVIVIAMALILAIVGGGSAAKTVSIAQAASGDYVNQRVQVSGNVVENSYSTKDNILTFSIYDPDSAADAILNIAYDGGAAATFGNDVTAICTGKIDESGTLVASELVTKCPSKYESGMDALGVGQMIDYGEKVLNKTVKVTGTIQPGSQNPAGSGDHRFVLVDAEDSTIMVEVLCDEALSSETIADNAKVVLTGNTIDSGKFVATNVAIEG
ncbi:MAG: cytochrome c maturation protein CcmE [Eggerthellaceae bacterium]|nr:cytochrome c maturation protein CcmE [Eggerthellaceae bacterium]